MELNYYKSAAIQIECRLREKRERELREKTESNVVAVGEPTAMQAIEQNSSNNTSAGADSLTEESYQPQTDPVRINVEVIPSPSPEHSAFEEVEPLRLSFDIDSTAPNTNRIRISSSRMSICGTPPKDGSDDNLDQSIYFTPSSRISSPENGPDNPEQLIRSNSYTIDDPSPMLIKHIKTIGISFDNQSNGDSNVDQSAASETDTLVDDSTNSIDRQQSNKTPSPSPKKSTAWMHNMSAKINEPPSKSPKQSRNSSDGQRSPHKAAKSRSSRFRSPAGTTMGSPSSTSSSAPPVEYNRILKLIEDQHANQVNELLWRQQEERKRMQLEFQLQQDELLQKIVDLVEHKTNPQNDTENIPSSNANVSDTDFNGNSDAEIYDSNRNVRMQTPDNDNKHRTSRRLDYKQSTASGRSTTDYVDPRAVEYVKKRESENKAATVINAHVRGYLTRRLFQTNKVGNMVKTIRDTLLFLLDMHFNRKDDESPADIELKSQLLQQVICAFFCLFQIIYIIFLLS